jgi:cytochrome c oxidase subunit 4
MTLADYRGIRPAAGEGAAEHAAGAVHRERAHPGPAEYIKIGLILAVITAVEVAVYYIDALEDVLIPILIVLSALKFSMVVMWFMHLRFDNRLFSTFFVGGLMLVATLFVIVLATLGGKLV